MTAADSAGTTSIVALAVASLAAAAPAGAQDGVAHLQLAAADIAALRSGDDIVVGGDPPPSAVASDGGAAQLAAIQTLTPSPAGTKPAPLPPPPPEQPLALREEDLLLVELRVDSLSVTDSLPVYQTPTGEVLVPLGELGRLLDLDLVVSPSERRITGTIGAARRSFLVDEATNTARLGGQVLPFQARQVLFTPTDAYLPADLLPAIFPAEAEFNSNELSLAFRTREKFPIQQRMERLARIRGLTPEVDSRDDALRLSIPYRIASAPSFDVSADTGTDTRPPRLPTRYDVRMAGDLLWSSFQGYLGSDSNGKPTSARVLFERRNPEGGELGPLDATRASLGDTFTPSLAIGARSLGGRGFSFTTQEVEQASVFDRIDLRGELPIGFDVELYVNDVLRGGQQTPVQGRYEFRDVPLVRGVNVIRIVTYGPRGERSEQTRVIRVGGGSLPKGELALEAGVIQQDRTVVDIGRDSIVPTPGQGDMRAVIGATYGIAENLTGVAGFATYTPTTGSRRVLGTVGLRTGIGGTAVTADAAYETKGGYGASLGLAGNLFKLPVVGRHAEYRKGFVDEALPFGGDGRALIRYSEVSTDIIIPQGTSGQIPISLRGQREQYADGTVSISGGVRTSLLLGSVATSASIDYVRTTSPVVPPTESMVGNVNASTFAAFQWQLRGSFDYDLLPKVVARAVSITADRDVADGTALRFGFGQQFTGDKQSTIQAGAIRRFKFADVSIVGDYSRPGNDWRIGVNIGFSFVYDPIRGRYRMTRPGAASGGNLAVRSFIDRDGDGRFTDGDEPVKGVGIAGGLSPVTTDAQGGALVTGLGAGRTARVQMSLEGVENPYFTSPPLDVTVVPRPGRTGVLPVPLMPTGEVLARVTYTKPDGATVGLSAVRLIAIPTGPRGRRAEALTEFDGSVIFEKMPAGEYSLELDPEQAARLKMEFTAPITFTVPVDGGFVPDISAMIRFRQSG